jgi:hypothetical protein
MDYLAPLAYVEIFEISADGGPGIMLTQLAPTNGQRNSRCYRVVYDDDLDTWSVVAIPFDGIYFTGSKMQCEAFATKYTERGVTTFRKSLGQQRFGISSSTASPGATWGSAQRQ